MQRLTTNKIKLKGTVVEKANRKLFAVARNSKNQTPQNGLHS